MTLTIAFAIDSVPFGPGEIDGSKSLGGSESACLGLARALQARGHQVHIFATKMTEDAPRVDGWGVRWHPMSQLDAISDVIEWDVFCALRIPLVFHQYRRARLRLLWNQDLMTGGAAKHQVMACAWAYDRVVYVSEFHRQQWEAVIPELKGIGYVTRNGYDPALVPNEVRKHPHRIIHISRPERALRPLLAMWPRLREKVPDAELHICRYNSMYDAQGWGRICAAFDEEVARVNEAVGGIAYLGELGKPALYQAIADAAVMWYPGVHDFAETSCIAAIEAQANGTPFVGSYKGALPETVPSGILIKGNADQLDYQQQSIQAVETLLRGCEHQSRTYRNRQAAGRTHVQRYTYAAIAEEWEGWLLETFRERYERHKLGVLRQLLHYDDHTAALQVAEQIISEAGAALDPHDLPVSIDPAVIEAQDARAFCQRVIAGQDQSAETYAAHALDPLHELALAGTRLEGVVVAFEGCTNLVDVACGSGAFAIGLCQQYPDLRVTAIDYAQGNIDAGKNAAAQVGVADRITWICAPVWDFTRNGFSDWWQAFAAEGRRFDGVWCGEFVEHVADCTGLVDGLEAVALPGAKVVYTCPTGPMTELLPRNIPLHRGHVHHFTADDVSKVWGDKQDIGVELLKINALTPRGSKCGHWLISYRTSDQRAGQRPYEKRILTTRPKATLSVGIIARNAERDLLRCLDAVWPIADEIVIGDTGSTDTTKDIAAQFPRTVRVIDIAPVHEQPEGFAGARNQVLQACRGDWFMWIDADEVLVGQTALWKYLEGGVFNGYALRQNHLQLDAPMHFDTPVRVFRTDRDIRFYGCVHEQPQMGHENGDITPGLQVTDVQIAHTGYLVEGIRREKMLNRNMPLLVKDQQVFPTRRLGKVLVLRDLVNLADYAAERNGGHYPDAARVRLSKAIGLFEEHFADPADKFHDVARPWYERALRGLGIGTEVELSLAGKAGGLNGGRAKPTRIWIRQAADLERYVQHKLAEIRRQMEPEPVRVDPFDEALEAVQEQVAAV